MSENPSKFMANSRRNEFRVLNVNEQRQQQRQQQLQQRQQPRQQQRQQQLQQQRQQRQQRQRQRQQQQEEQRQFDNGESIYDESANDNDSKDNELHNLLYDLMASNRTVDAKFWIDRDTLTAYPVRLFESKRLTRDGISMFPRDSTRFDETVRSQRILTDYWRYALRELIGHSPLLRTYDVDTFEIDATLVPLLHVTLSDSLAVHGDQLSKQDVVYESLEKKAKLLISNMDSLYHWAMHYCNSALTLVRLFDDNAQRVRQLDEVRYSNRVRVLEEERVRLNALLRRAENNYERTLERYRRAFARELVERQKIVDLLTNYLSGSLYKFRGNPNYIEPRKPVTFDRADVKYRVETLIPYYRKLRLMLIERSMLKSLVASLNEYSAATSNVNPLVKEYF